MTVTLDEPTSALDIESEIFILKSMKKLLKGKTAIIITHRKKILELCDKVICLDDYLK